MTRSLTAGKFAAQLTGSIRNQLTTGKTAAGAINATLDLTLNNGADANQSNRGWEVSGTLSADETLVIDLFDFGSIDLGAGAGADIVGQAMALDDITVIVVMNKNTSGDGELEVEPDDTNGWGPIGSHTTETGGRLAAGGALIKCRPTLPGFVIADGSSHRIKLTAVGGDVSYQVALLGRTDEDSSSSSSSSSSSDSSSSSSSSSSSG